MISSRHRFHGYNSLRYVYKNGKSIRGPLFAVKSVVNPRRKTYRVAVVVSRKVNKSAVARNRIRRRLYEIIRQLEDDILQPYDVVLTVFHDALLDTPQAALTRQVKKQLRESGVLARRVKRPSDPS